MLEMGLPVGAGTDATRVASYDPWVGLYWMATGKSLGGLRLTAEANTLDRETALRLWTEGSAWFSGEEAVKGRLALGFYADLAVLSADYFAVPAEEIRGIAALLTMVGGRIVHGAGDFADLAPPLPPASPDWSPVGAFASPGLRTAAAGLPQPQHARACHDGCQSGCSLHGHGHQIAWASPLCGVRAEAMTDITLLLCRLALVAFYLESAVGSSALLVSRRGSSRGMPRSPLLSSPSSRRRPSTISGRSRMPAGPTSRCIS
jgi:hypothetical protein